MNQPHENQQYSTSGVSASAGINATDGLHDYFQTSLGLGWARRVFNVPGMPVAAAITYMGILAGPQAVNVALLIDNNNTYENQEKTDYNNMRTNLLHP